VLHAPGTGPADPGRDEDPARRAAEPEGPAGDEPVPWEPVVTRPDWMTGEDWQAYLDAAVGDDEPSERRRTRRRSTMTWRRSMRSVGRSPRIRPALPRAARLGTTGALGAIAAARRGPGQPGSARRFAGEYPSRAAQFATGMLMDTMPGRPELAQFADEAAGQDDSFDGASDDEVLGLLCAWDRVEAHAAARKHAAVAELMR
jgi:hypothetical protein